MRIAQTAVIAFLSAHAVFATAPVPPPAPPAPEVAAPSASSTLAASTGRHARDVAEAYGVEKAHGIEAIAFSFNVQFGERRIRREWFWNVAESRIEYSGDGPTGLPISHVYYRDAIDEGDAALNEAIDKMFVDDQYWLLFPLHLAWERDLAVGYQPARTMYIEPREAECLTVRYPEGVDGGGDTYEIFIGADRLIREWAYIPKGFESPALVTTWERHAKAGPLLFSLMHRSDDGEFRVWFDRVAVKFVDDGWVDAEPLDQILTRTPEPETPSKNPL